MWGWMWMKRDSRKGGIRGLRVGIIGKGIMGRDWLMGLVCCVFG